MTDRANNEGKGTRPADTRPPTKPPAKPGKKADKKSTDRLLDVRELADLIGKSPNAIRMLNKKGKAPPRIRIGRTCHYWESEVLRWLKSLEVK